MAFLAFLFLLAVCLLLSLKLLWRPDWFPFRPSSSRRGAKRTTLHRLLKPRCPDDCPAYRLSCTNSSVVGPAPAPVRPWPEVKSRQGAPKRINTEGYACPNQQCQNSGITHAMRNELSCSKEVSPDRSRWHAWLRSGASSRRQKPSGEERQVWRENDCRRRRIIGSSHGMRNELTRRKILAEEEKKGL